MTRPSFVLTVGLMAVSAVLAGCRADRADTSPSAPPPATVTATPTTPVPGEARPDERTIEVPGLAAILEQYREDEIQRLISVKTTNRSTSTVQFRDLRLVWPGLDDTQPYVRSTQLAPGVRFDLRVHQGEAVCGSPPDVDAVPPADAAIAVGHASIDGAPPVLVSVPVDDEDSILSKVFRRSCQEQYLRWAADLQFGNTWTHTTTASGEPAVRGTLELRRKSSDAPLAVTRINGSVLLRITAERPSDPIATLGPRDDAVSIPIVIEQSGNCSAHALAESKKTFIIPIDVAVGDRDPMAYVVTFDLASQRLLNDMINASCNLG